MPPRVYLSTLSGHRPPPSRPSPFMLPAARGDPSLLVCAVEDSWTSSFRYKSPSEADSGDSDLITAGGASSGLSASLTHLSSPRRREVTQGGGLDARRAESDGRVWGSVVVCVGDGEKKEGK
ncbi:unnamed protein product [Pleuronectes platessa]|uniref:Uncharacterized protein n=1 Tax=Pleuronectes platessa TaxID=8262 RepID=A0A9N7V3A4_PLEPL|nr:unnamed protein product [Pleuronectes platessa]